MLALLFPVTLETLDYTGNVRRPGSPIIAENFVVVATAQSRIAVSGVALAVHLYKLILFSLQSLSLTPSHSKGQFCL